MNIPVKTFSGHVVVRPDTTYKRGDDAFYAPEFVSRVSWTPVLFARICKPGRSISARFADRYYDGIGYGVLLYPEDLVDGSAEGFASASCIDHTSFLCYPVYNKATLGRKGNHFTLTRDGNRLYDFNSATEEMICQAIEDVTKYCYVRNGDMLAIELAPRELLAVREDAQTVIRGTYCDNDILDFKLVF